MVDTSTAVQKYTIQETAASTTNYMCSSVVGTHDDSKMSRHAAGMQFLGPEQKTGPILNKIVWFEDSRF